MSREEKETSSSSQQSYENSNPDEALSALHTILLTESEVCIPSPPSLMFRRYLSCGSFMDAQLWGTATAAKPAHQRINCATLSTRRFQLELSAISTVVPLPPPTTTRWPPG